jgi:glycosyltransferase involved in cell wall biosynthesis
MNPCVSVIIPVHNAAPWLERCLDSLSAQTLRDYEVLLVDDASTDASPRIAERYCVNFPDIFRYVRRNARKGPGPARNTGLTHARGEYIGFVDSDDTVRPEMFATLYDAARGGQADIVMCGYDEKYGAKETRHTPPAMTRDELLQDRLWQPCPWNKLFRRAVIERYGLRFPETYFGDDMAFIAKFLFHTAAITIVPEPLYMYWKRDGSLSFSLAHRRWALVSLRELFDYARDKGFYEGHKHALWKHFYYQAVYYPACLVLVDGLIKGYGRWNKLVDLPGYLYALSRFLLRK